MILTSRQNPRLQWIRKLRQDASARRQEGLWLLEGLRLAEEALRGNRPVRLWVIAEGWGESGGREGSVRCAVESRGEDVLRVGRGLLRELADTQSPQGILCLVEAPRWSVGETLAGSAPALVLDRVQDPGNLGTLARSVEASGASGILLAPGTVDPGSPKALRASAGSLLRLPVVFADDPVAAARSSGRRIAAAAGQGGVPPEEADLGQPFALLIGQEGSGLAEGLRAQADLHLSIPMAGQVESLNAATAAAVILFEAARQRRRGSARP